jgi:hypothetical protein
MIKAACCPHEVDGVLQEWPHVFVSMPRVGDRVMAQGGKTLYVQSVTHCTNSMEPLEPFALITLVPRSEL